MRGSVLLLISLSLAGCLNTQPKAPVVKECRLIIADNVSESYMFCTIGDQQERVPISSIEAVPQSSQGVWVCTTFNYYAVLKNFQSATEDWIKDNCGPSGGAY
jgi:hypothetical protein